MRSLIVAVLCLVSLPAFGQAFGTHAGMKSEEFSYANNTSAEPEKFYVTPPQENPLISSYWAWIGPNVGLCSIVGYGEFNGDIDAKLASLTAAISDIYGEAMQGGNTTHWRASEMSIALTKFDEGEYALGYNFRAREDCKADAIDGIIDRTGL